MIIACHHQRKYAHTTIDARHRPSSGLTPFSGRFGWQRGRKRAWLGSLIVTMLFPWNGSAATVAERYSFQEDFSLTENTEKSVWSYRFQANGVPNNTARDGQYELMTDRVESPNSYSPNGKTGWCDSSGFNGTVEMPQVVKNTRSFTSEGIPPNETVMHPDWNQIVVVSWLAQRAGTIKLSYEFTDLVVGASPYEDGVTWFVDVGDASGNLAAGLLQPGTSTGPRTLTDIHVLAGDRVNFIVGPNGTTLDKSWFDTTDLKAVIEYTDTPVATITSPAAAFPLTNNAMSNEWACVFQADGVPDNLARDGAYELLTRRITTFYGLTNVVGWTAPGGLPAVVMNTNATTTGSSGLQLEPSGVLLHPAPNQLVGMRWQAPHAGQVSIQFQFDDLDWGGGDGVDWYLQQPQLGQELASGSINRGGTGRRTATAQVSAGEQLVFLVSPKGADHTYDSTKLWASIRYLEPLTMALTDSSEAERAAKVTWGFPSDQQLYRATDIDGPWRAIADTMIGLGGVTDLKYQFEEAPNGPAAYFKLNRADVNLPRLPLQFSALSSNFLGGIPPAFLNVQIGNITFAEWQTNALMTTSSTRLDEERTSVTYAWNDSAGLEISCEAVCYSDFPAVEWLMWVKNNGVSNSPPLQNLCPLDAVFTGEPGNVFNLHSSAGGQQSRDAFRPGVEFIREGTRKTLRNTRGRPSEQVLPFFDLESGQSGAVFAVGWSGQWLAEIAGLQSQEVRLLVQQEALWVRLRPGEQIRSPRMLMMTYAEGRTAGLNTFRRFMSRHVYPQNTNAQIPGIQMNTWYVYGDNGYPPINETNLVHLLQAYHALDIDTVVIDACWNGESWFADAGNWKPSTNRFPNGLSPVGQAATNLNMRLGLWFELEKAATGTAALREHPELFISPIGFNWALLDLGSPAAREWYVTNLNYYLTNTPLAYFKHDYNINPKPFWRARDRADGIGLSENLYVQGLYSTLDQIRATHPDVVFEGCSSGGLRMDWEMLRRVDCYFKSDLWFDPVGHQSHIMGASPYLSANCLLAPFKSFDPDPYAFRSQLGAAMSCGWDPDDPNYNPVLVADRVREFNALRHLFQGDFYPLFTHSTSDADWAGWQFHRSDSGEGLAVVFRRAAAVSDSASITLNGLKPDALYQFVWVDAGVTNQLNGTSLSQPMTVTLTNRPNSALLLYHEVGP